MNPQFLVEDINASYSLLHALDPEHYPVRYEIVKENPIVIKRTMGGESCTVTCDMDFLHEKARVMNLMVWEYFDNVIEYEDGC